MKFRVMCACAVFAVAAVASAQTKDTFSGKCAKADKMESIPAGDKDGHVFMIQQGKCTTGNGDLGGAKSKEGIFSEHDEAMGTHSKVWGVYVETFDNGDKLFYRYTGGGTTKDGAFVSGDNKWQVTGGAGKMKGAKGMGSCKLAGNADRGLDYECTGERTLAAAK